MGTKSLFAISLAIILAILVGCGLSDAEIAAKKKVEDKLAHDALVATSIDRMRSISIKWSNDLELAISTPRIALAPQVKDLQAIRDEFRAISPPDCLTLAHSDMKESMDAAIEGLMSFMRSDEIRANISLSKAREMQQFFTEDLACITSDEKFARNNRRFETKSKEIDAIYKQTMGR